MKSPRDPESRSARTGCPLILIVATTGFGISLVFSFGLAALRCSEGYLLRSTWMPLSSSAETWRTDFASKRSTLTYEAMRCQQASLDATEVKSAIHGLLNPGCAISY